MKRNLLYILLLTCIAPVFSQENKVVGYLPYYRFALSDNIEYEKLTHLCIAFANPDIDGNLDVGGQDIQPIADAAHDKGVIVLLSLAGGALTTEWAEAWAKLTKPQHRSAFIHKIMIYLEAHELEGADVDLEWSYVDDNYSGFVLELRDSIDAHDMLMTAALPGTYRYPEITDEAMFAYDFINMMAYDLTGPWAPDNPGPHSPYSFALQSINYWKAQGMAGENLTLGLPFYGYDFSNSSNVTSFTFGSIVAEDESYAWIDQVGQRYYNGITTIQLKTELGNDEVAGVCIWELGQDAFNEYSLLNTVYEINNPTNGEEVFAENNLRVFPNPFIDKLNLKNLPSEKHLIQLFRANGQLIQEWESLQPSLLMELPNLQNGIYFLSIKNKFGTINKKLVK